MEFQTFVRLRLSLWIFRADIWNVLCFTSESRWRLTNLPLLRKHFSTMSSHKRFSFLGLPSLWESQLFGWPKNSFGFSTTCYKESKRTFWPTQDNCPHPWCGPSLCLLFPVWSLKYEAPGNRKKLSQKWFQCLISTLMCSPTLCFETCIFS